MAAIDQKNASRQSERTVILHYHLFKNAGTSLDRILKNNFGAKWVTKEFRMEGGNNSGEIAEWIRSTPDAVAYSTHTAVGPLPHVEGVRVIPVILLRDPIARIFSAYRFERRQEADTWGANLAKEHDLEGYVRTRLARPNDRQCRNFQAERLASMQPGDAPELERALQALESLYQEGVVGVVEDFDGFTKRLANRLQAYFPDFAAESVRANISEKDTESEAPAVTQLLEDVNRDDLTILNAVRTRLGLQPD